MSLGAQPREAQSMTGSTKYAQVTDLLSSALQAQQDVWLVDDAGPVIQQPATAGRT